MEINKCILGAGWGKLKIYALACLAALFLVNSSLSAQERTANPSLNDYSGESKAKGTESTGYSRPQKWWRGKNFFTLVAFCMIAGTALGLTIYKGKNSNNSTSLLTFHNQSKNPIASMHHLTDCTGGIPRKTPVPNQFFIQWGRFKISFRFPEWWSKPPREQSRRSS